MREITTTYFEDIEEFCENIVEVYEDIKENSTEYEDVSIIALYEEARHIVSELIRCGFEIKDMYIYDSEWEGYDDEYIISIYDDGIWVEPFKRGNKYLRKTGYEVMKSIKSSCKTGNELYDYILKKENEGKIKKVAKIAGLNKFLRMYYGKVKKKYKELEIW